MVSSLPSLAHFKTFTMFCFFHKHTTSKQSVYVDGFGLCFGMGKKCYRMSFLYIPSLCCKCLNVEQIIKPSDHTGGTILVLQKKKEILSSHFQAKPAALKTSLLILMLSPVCNSFLFGFRNKVRSHGYVIIYGRNLAVNYVSINNV